MKNGHDPQWDDPKIRSLSAARKEKAEAAKKQGAAGKPQVAGRGVGEWLFGAVIVAMAIGLVVSVTRPLWQGALSFAP